MKAGRGWFECPTVKLAELSKETVMAVPQMEDLFGDIFYSDVLPDLCTPRLLLSRGGLRSNKKQDGHN